MNILDLLQKLKGQQSIPGFGGTNVQIPGMTPGYGDDPLAVAMGAPKIGVFGGQGGMSSVGGGNAGVLASNQGVSGGSGSPSKSSRVFERVMNGLLGTPNNYGGLLDQGTATNANKDARTAMFASLLESSGQPVGLGQAIGRSVMAGRGAQNEGLQAALNAQLMRSRIDAQNNKVSPDGVGDYQPGDYTPASWAKFVKSKDPADLERYVSPRQETSKPFQNITRQYPDGSTQQGSFDARTGEFLPSGPLVPAGTKARADAEAQAVGEAAGAQTAKAPAKASFDAAIENLRASIKATPQGMIAGPLGTVTDYGDKKLFQSRVQQLSTELRTVYRIPGEGTLSDQEQKQYGLQLPSTDFPPEVNEQILTDLEQRTKLRTETPVGDKPKTKKKYNPATGKIE